MVVVGSFSISWVVLLLFQRCESPRNNYDVALQKSNGARLFRCFPNTHRVSI